MADEKKKNETTEETPEVEETGRRDARSRG